MEVVGRFEQTVRFDGKVLEVGPRAEGIAVRRRYPRLAGVTEPETAEPVVIRVGEIRKLRFRPATRTRSGSLRVTRRLRAGETAKPFWWASSAEHPRTATVFFTLDQQASFETLRDAIMSSLATTRAGTG
jgi:hypothetical protein